MRKTAMFLFICVILAVFASCGNGTDADTASVVDEDIALLAEKTGLDASEAGELYALLLAEGMQAGIKYVTDWTDGDGELFYRIRTSDEVFDVYLSGGEPVIVLYGEGTESTEKETESEAESESESETELPLPPEGDIPVVINVRSKKYHAPDCASVEKMSTHNRLDLSVASLDDLAALGYEPCGACGGTASEEDTAESQAEETAE